MSEVADWESVAAYAAVVGAARQESERLLNVASVLEVQRNEALRALDAVERQRDSLKSEVARMTHRAVQTQAELKILRAFKADFS